MNYTDTSSVAFLDALRGATVIDLPPGAPSWITADLWKTTASVWQPHYDHPLTQEDILGILLNTGALLDILEDAHG